MMFRTNETTEPTVVPNLDRNLVEYLALKTLWFTMKDRKIEVIKSVQAKGMFDI